MATFYKGAGVGTHWHANDSRQVGFAARSPEVTPSTETLIDHISTSTANSPYISLTCSYAVAWYYAMWGGTTGIIPTKNNPGYVYEIEIDCSLPTELKLFDPIKEVALSLQEPTDVDVNKEFPFYQHNGLPNVNDIFEIVQKLKNKTGEPYSVGSYGGSFDGGENLDEVWTRFSLRKFDFDDKPINK